MEESAMIRQAAGARASMTASESRGYSVHGGLDNQTSSSSTGLAILCPKTWGVRNVVHSGMIGHLKQRGLRACLLVPGEDLSQAPDDWGACAELLRTPVFGSQRGLSFLAALTYASFSRRHDVNFRRILGPWSRRHDGPWLIARHVAVEALSVIGSREPLYSWQIRYRERWIRRTRDFGPIIHQLKQLRPLLVVSTNSQFSEEHPYIMAAQELGIPTLGCIQSFDNLTTRGILPVFDHYAVWNQRMKDQVLAYYPDRIPDTVHITGTPQFDFHVRPEWRWNREMTLAELGLQPGERYILVAPTNLPTQPELLIALDDRCSATPELRRHRIVVRPHPVDQRARWEALVREHPRMVLSWPWKVVPQASWDAPRLPRAVDQTRLVSTLLHADVCLNTTSTISLDAAVVGTPVVCIGFTGRRGGPEDRLCLEGHFTDHFRPITESGGIRLVRNMEELVGAVLAYLRDRALDAAARRMLVASECGPVDGNAAVRVADLIAMLTGPGDRATARVIESV